MPVAEIITIGTEILLGEIVDTNAPYLARALRDLGVNLFRKTSVGDNPERIAQAIREALSRSQIIITTGGLGPTVDDPTRLAVAQAFGVELHYLPELWAQIEDRFRRYGRPPTENNRRQAYLPLGARAIENPVGTAPAFVFELPGQAVISLPGVPSEMEYLMQNAVLPYLRQRFDLRETIKARVLHTAGVGESQIDDLIGDLEELANPTVGLAAHSGQVDVRIVAKAGSQAEADALIQTVEADLRRRLGNWIYGADEDSLESLALRAVQSKGWQLVAVEAGLGGELVHRLVISPGPFLGGEVLPVLPHPDRLPEILEDYRRSASADAALGVALFPGKEKQEVSILLITPEGIRQFNRPYGGAPQNAPRWAMHHSLDLLRNL